MSATSDTLQKRQDYNLGSPNRANVVLFLCDTPVISVEQGTTFGLTKMLYESIGGHGQIIGLRQRQNSSTLACIVTQDQTVLNEREYDIIVHGGNTAKDRSLDGKSPNYHDEGVNTYISFNPYAHVWWPDSLSTRRQPPWDKDPHTNQTSCTSGSLVETTTRGDISPSKKRRILDNSNGCLSKHTDTQVRQPLVPTRNALEYVPSQNAIKIDYAERDEQTDETRGVSPRDSSSPSTIDTASPGGSNEISPSQLEQSRPHKRKWQCFYCKKFFVCRSAYENHERTHTGEKPFQCTVCGRCFGHQGNLKQHLHIHREVKPHVCDVCGRGFTRSNRLRDHKRSHMENQYELLMHARVQWTPTQSGTTENRGELVPGAASGFEEATTSDENQEAL